MHRGSLRTRHRLLQDERARDRAAHTKVVNVAIDDTAVVGHHRYVVACRQPQSDVDVDGEARSLIHHHDFLAVERE